MCCQKKWEHFNQNESIMLKGIERVQNDMNMFTILSTLQKMRATLDVLVGDDIDKLNLIHQKYFESATIRIDPIEEQLFENKQSEYSQFLERDERFRVKYLHVLHSNNVF